MEEAITHNISTFVLFCMFLKFVFFNCFDDNIVY